MSASNRKENASKKGKAGSSGLSQFHDQIGEANSGTLFLEQISFAARAQA